MEIVQVTPLRRNHISFLPNLNALVTFSAFDTVGWVAGRACGL